MATIREVAKRAKVAPITVSRVVNNSGYVSDETRARVNAAIQELGYVPNLLGPSLRLKRTNTIGLILSDVTNPFFTTVARGVEDVANESGYNVFFCNTDESHEKQTRYINSLLGRQVDGILLVPASDDTADINVIKQQDVKLVVMDRHVSSDVDMVRCDSENGSYEIIKHLIALGHTRIATLGGPRSISTSEERIAGYTRALKEAGLPIGAVFHGNFDQPSGYAMAQQALALPPRPTALFAVNNFISIGAMKALLDAGLRVPKDISVVGVDDLPPTLTLNPFMTVVSQPAYDMGKQAAQLLLKRLQEGAEKVSKPREIILPSPLVMRHSTAPPSTNE